MEKQSFQNHARFYPPFHFVLLPLLLINLGLSIAYTVKHYYRHVHLGPWWIVMSVALFLTAGLSRNMALKAQDRVIRLEERLRLIHLGVAHEVIYGLSTSQLIGLRFASDGEVPVLAERALREQLTLKQIKASVQSWRADHERV